MTIWVKLVATYVVVMQFKLCCHPESLSVELREIFCRVFADSIEQRFPIQDRHVLQVRKEKFC